MEGPGGLGHVLICHSVTVTRCWGCSFFCKMRGLKQIFKSSSKSLSLIKCPLFSGNFLQSYSLLLKSAEKEKFLQKRNTCSFDAVIRPGDFSGIKGI